MELASFFFQSALNPPLSTFTARFPNSFPPLPVDFLPHLVLSILLQSPCTPHPLLHPPSFFLAPVPFFLVPGHQTPSPSPSSQTRRQCLHFSPVNRFIFFLFFPPCHFFGFSESYWLPAGPGLVFLPSNNVQVDFFLRFCSLMVFRYEIQSSHVPE